MSTIKGLGPVRPTQLPSAAPASKAVSGAGGVAPAPVHEDVALFDGAAAAVAAGTMDQSAAVRKILSAAIEQQMPGLSKVAQTAVAARLEALVLAQPELVNRLDRLLG